MNKQLHKALVYFLRNKADDTNVINLHNEHASDDDYVYGSIEEIAELVATDDATKIARMVFFGNVQAWQDNYFCLDGYGNINSFRYAAADLSPVDFELLSAHIIEPERFDEVGFDANPYLSDDE